MTTPTPTLPTARIALRGDLLDFTGEPAWGERDSGAVRFRPDHWLLIENGRIQGVQADAPGDGWQRFANMRAYYCFMFGHPGKKLMFMGCEFAQEREWSHDR